MSKVKELESEIEELKQELEAFRSQSMLARLYKIQIKMIVDMEELCKNFTINTATLESKDDKVFDRYLQIVLKSKSIAETIAYLSEKITPQKADEISKEYGNIADSVILSHG